MGETVVITFAWPYIFALIPLPWLAYKCLPQDSFNMNAKLRVPVLTDFAVMQQPLRYTTGIFQKLCLFFIWLSLLTAAARPQWVGDVVSLPQRGRDIMLAVDLSGSMQFRDFAINGQLTDRLSAVKLVAGDFIDRRKGDRLGLILFGTQAYLQTPLTFDTATVKQLLMESAVGLAGEKTAIGDAIALAVKQLRNSPQASRTLILLTDGNNNAGEMTPEKAAEIASHENMKIHTVAIGPKPKAQAAYLRHPALSSHNDIDEKALQLIAEKTSGSYFRAYNTDELAKIYRQIDQLEKHEQAGHYFRPTKEIYFWPLALALLALSLLTTYKYVLRWQR